MQPETYILIIENKATQTGRLCVLEDGAYELPVYRVVAAGYVDDLVNLAKRANKDVEPTK